MTAWGKILNAFAVETIWMCHGGKKLFIQSSLGFMIFFLKFKYNFTYNQINFKMQFKQDLKIIDCQIFWNKFNLKKFI